MNINEIVLSDEIMVRFQKILLSPLLHKRLLKSYSVKLCASSALLCVIKKLFHYSNLYGLYDAKVQNEFYK